MQVPTDFPLMQPSPYKTQNWLLAHHHHYIIHRLYSEKRFHPLPTPTTLCSVYHGVYMNLCHNTRLTRILRITSEYVAYGFSSATDGWGRCMSFTTYRIWRFINEPPNGDVAAWWPSLKGRNWKLVCIDIIFLLVLSVEYGSSRNSNTLKDFYEFLCLKRNEFQILSKRNLNFSIFVQLIFTKYTSHREVIHAYLSVFLQRSFLGTPLRL